MRFSYLYRDGSNNKRYGDVVFANPEKMTAEEANEAVKSVIDDGEYFIAGQVGVPEVFLWVTAPAFTDAKVIPDIDHGWHEFDGFVETCKEPTDKRTLKEFIAAVKAAAEAGWVEVDPPARAAEKEPHEHDNQGS